MIKSIDLYPSSYPPAYGGASMGILNIHTLDDYSEKINLFGSFGLISSDITYNNKIWNGILTLSGRRTYYDLVASFFNYDFPNYFFDLFGKYRYIADSNNTLTIMAFYSKDNMDFKFENNGGKYEFNDDQRPNWKNLLYSLTWDHSISTNQHINILLYNSQYSYRFLRKRNEFIDDIDNTIADYNNRFSQSGIKAKYFYGSEKLNFLSGFEYSYQNINYFWLTKSVIGDEEIKVPHTYFMDFAPPKFDFFDFRKTAAGFVQMNYKNNKNVDISIGARIEKEISRKIIYLSPYIKIGYYGFCGLDLSVSYNRHYQALVYYDDKNSEFLFNAFSLPFFSENVIPKSDHFSFSTKKIGLTDNIDFSFEGYFINKSAIPYISPLDRKKMIYNEKLFGFDFMLKYSVDRLSGILSYNFGRAIREENRVRFPGNYDQKHNLKIFLDFRISNNFDLCSEYFYNSGFPYSMPSFVFYGNDLSDLYNDNLITTGELGKNLFLYPNPIYTNRNNFRNPIYSRIDVTLKYDLPVWGGKLTPFVSIINLLNHSNYYLENIILYKKPISLDYFKGLPIIPNVGVKFEY